MKGFKYKGIALTALCSVMPVQAIKPDEAAKAAGTVAAVVVTVGTIVGSTRSIVADQKAGRPINRPPFRPRW